MMQKIFQTTDSGCSLRPIPITHKPLPVTHRPLPVTYWPFSVNYWPLVSRVSCEQVIDSIKLLTSHSPCSHETFKMVWKRFQSIWSPCEHKQKVSNRFKTNLAQTYLRVGLKSVWNQFGDINRHVNAPATCNLFGFNCFCP